MEHHLLEHQEEEVPRYAMEVLKYPKINLQRQAEEAEQIMRHETANLAEQEGGKGAKSPPKAVPGGPRSSRDWEKEAWSTGCGCQEKIQEEEDGLEMPSRNI